jgi:predicted DNA-binding mobile mystery protein A
MSDLYHIQQLDKKLEPLAPIKTVPLPLKGWINVIRETLGMTQKQLANYLSLTPSRIKKIEESEANKTLKLSTLQRVAEKLGCELHYVLLPKKESFSELIQQQALKISNESVLQTAHHMVLEDQAAPIEIQEQTYLLAQGILHKSLKRLWDHEI